MFATPYQPQASLIMTVLLDNIKIQEQMDPGTVLYIALIKSFLTPFILAHIRVVEILGLFSSELFSSYQLCLSCSKLTGLLDRQSCSHAQSPKLAWQTLVLRRGS